MILSFSDTLPAVGFLLGGVAIQFFFGFMFKRWWLRLLSVLLLALAGGALLVAAVVIQGWAAVALIAFAIYTWLAAGSALICFAAMEITFFVRKRKR